MVIYQRPEAKPEGKGTVHVNKGNMVKNRLKHLKRIMEAAVRTVRLVQMGVKALVPQVNSLFPFTSSTLM